MLPGRYAVGFSSDSGDVPLMPLLRDEIRDHSVEEMLFIRRAAIAFLLVVVCFGVLIVNLYHLQVEQHDFYQTRSNQNDIKMLPIAPSRGLIFDRNGIPLVQNITLYRLQVIPSKIPDMAALLQLSLIHIFHLTSRETVWIWKQPSWNSSLTPVSPAVWRCRRCKPPEKECGRTLIG